MKQISHVGVVFLCLLALASCGKATMDKSGVPIIESASVPVVDGQALSALQFYNKYCKKPETALDPTCVSVGRSVDLQQKPMHIQY
jgi:hypothetical protein